MRTKMGTLVAIALLGALPAVSPAFAQHEGEGAGHSHARAETHGGSTTMSKEFHFETVFRDEAVAVYMYDGSQKPVDAKGVAGSVELQFRDRSRQPLQAQLKYVPGEAGEVGYLRGDLDLSGISDGDAKAKIELSGLSGRSETEVSYRETFRLAADDDHDDGHDDEHGHD